MRHLRVVHESEDLADHWDARERSEERALDEHDDHECAEGRHFWVDTPICHHCGVMLYPEEGP